jgi:glycerol-3-phosphate O-acyltransferase
LDDTVLSVVHRKLVQNHHFYQAIFVIVWEWLEHCQTERWEFVALWGLTRGIPPDLEHEANHLKTRWSVSRSKGDVIVLVWTDKRLVWLISKIHDATEVNTGRKDNRTALKIKKTFICHYSVLKKTVKQPNVSAKHALFGALQSI